MHGSRNHSTQRHLLLATATVACSALPPLLSHPLSPICFSAHLLPSSISFPLFLSLLFQRDNHFLSVKSSQINTRCSDASESDAFPLLSLKKPSFNCPSLLIVWTESFVSEKGSSKKKKEGRKQRWCGVRRGSMVVVWGGGVVVVVNQSRHD